ncbi:MAG: flagellar export chaperone FlgN [Oleibacter sp.]|nr:flagellar export chaperone FlgN [Thalassolituus sp.]
MTSTTDSSSAASSATNAATFSQQLSSELDICCTLNELMHQEMVALTQGKTDELSNLNPVKNTLVKQLRDVASARLTLMSDLGMAHSHDDFQRSTFATIPEIKALWQTLEQQYLTNSKLSETLQNIVLSMRYRNQQKLKILHGRQNEPHLYDNQGKSSDQLRGTRSIKV